MFEVKWFNVFNNTWDSWIFERVSRPAVICPTDSGTAAKPMPSQGEERNKMDGNSYWVCSHQQKRFFFFISDCWTVEKKLSCFVWPKASWRTMPMGRFPYKCRKPEGSLKMAVRVLITRYKQWLWVVVANLLFSLNVSSERNKFL